MKLWKHLFENPEQEFKSDLRPTRDIHSPTHINMSVGLNNIIHVDDKHQVLEVYVWVRLHWKDDVLRWNKSDFNGVESIYVPSSVLWLPDITPLKNVAAATKPTLKEIMIHLKHTGHVHYEYPLRLLVSCPLNVRYFPFDYQQCQLPFGSWTLWQSQIDIHAFNGKGILDIRIYEQNNEWNLRKYMSYKKERHLVTKNGVEQVEISIETCLLLERHTGSYIYYLIIPILLIQGLSGLQFMLPADTGEKIQLGMTVFLSMIIYLVMVADILPYADSVPLLVEFLDTTLISVAIYQVAAVLMLIAHFKGIHDNNYVVPYWLRKVFLHWIASAIGMRKLITEDKERNLKVTGRFEDSIIGEDEDSILRMQRTRVKPTHKRGVHSTTEADEAPGTEITPFIDETENPVIDDTTRQKLQLLEPQKEESDVSVIDKTKRLFQPDDSEEKIPTAFVPRERRERRTALRLQQREYRLLDSILMYCEDIKLRLLNADRQFEIHTEWQQVAMVLDRLVFIISVIWSLSIMLWIITPSSITDEGTACLPLPEPNTTWILL